ncbi:CLUMA_CG021167, isoform A [Clunio marinus]|uniref:CLUMA_CG021167, isoform A n=1 Tax=Clunio marinus TaxID=568069 RepID=A0A1J1JA47_9DIPT|nr:CLUMA_CG021167, isoform A [Clunio marinus]
MYNIILEELTRRLNFSLFSVLHVCFTFHKRRQKTKNGKVVDECVTVYTKCRDGDDDDDVELILQGFKNLLEKADQGN